MVVGKSRLLSHFLTDTEQTTLLAARIYNVARLPGIPNLVAVCLHLAELWVTRARYTLHYLVGSCWLIKCGYPKSCKRQNIYNLHVYIHIYIYIYTYIYIYDRYCGNAMVHGDAQWSHITWRDESSAPKQGVALSICWMFLGRGTPVPVVARALVQLLRVEMKVPSLIGEGIGLCQEPWWFNKHFTSFI